MFCRHLRLGVSKLQLPSASSSPPWLLRELHSPVTKASSLEVPLTFLSHTPHAEPGKAWTAPGTVPAGWPLPPCKSFWPLPLILLSSAACLVAVATGILSGPHLLSTLLPYSPRGPGSCSSSAGATGLKHRSPAIPSAWDMLCSPVTHFSGFTQMLPSESCSSFPI